MNRGPSSPGDPAATGGRVAGDGGALGEWRRGWPVVLASIVGTAMAAMTPTSLGVLMKPIGAAMGWSRAQVAFGPFLNTLPPLLLSWLIGRLVHKYGARRLALAGMTLAPIFLMAIGLSTRSVWTWYAAWVGLALAHLSMTPLVWAMGVSSRFSWQRGLALGLGQAGFALSSTVMPIVCVKLTEAYSWRAAYFLMAALTLVVGLFSTWRLFFDAADLSKSAGKAAPGETLAEAPKAGLDMWQILRTTHFWRLTVAMVGVGGAVGSLNAHIQPLLTDRGLAPVTAAALGAVSGPSVLVGRVMTGFLLDHLPTNFIAAFVFALPGAASLALLYYSGNIYLAVFALIASGFALGSEFEVLTYATIRYFGLKAYGAALGLLMGVYSLGFGLGPVLAGMVVDQSRSYDLALKIMIGATAAAVVIAVSLGRASRSFDVVHLEAQPWLGPSS